MVPMCFAVYFVSLKSLRLTPANPSSCPTSPVDRHPSWTSSGRLGFLLGSSTRPRRRFRTISKTAWSRRRLLGVANRGGARCGWGRTGRELNFAMLVRDVRLCQCKDASILQYLGEAKLRQCDHLRVGFLHLSIIRRQSINDREALSALANLLCTSRQPQRVLIAGPITISGDFRPTSRHHALSASSTPG